MCFSSNEVDSKRVYSEGNRCFFFSYLFIYLCVFIHPPLLDSHQLLLLLLLL